MSWVICLNHSVFLHRAVLIELRATAWPSLDSPSFLMSFHSAGVSLMWFHVEWQFDRVLRAEKWKSLKNVSLRLLYSFEYSFKWWTVLCFSRWTKAELTGCEMLPCAACAGNEVISQVWTHPLVTGNVIPYRIVGVQSSPVAAWYTKKCNIL